MATNAFPPSPKTKSKFPVLLIIGALVLAGGGAFWYYWPLGDSSGIPLPSSGTGVAPLGVASGISAEDEAKVAQILQAIETLKTLSLDTKFFEDPRVTALKETEVVIPDIVPFQTHPFKFSSDNPAKSDAGVSTPAKKK